MSSTTQCPECQSTDLRTCGDIPTRGGHGPGLLPGASGLFATARMRVVVCHGCGLIRYYASEQALANLAADTSGRWKRPL